MYIDDTVLDEKYMILPSFLFMLVLDIFYLITSCRTKRRLLWEEGVSMQTDSEK